MSAAPRPWRLVVDLDAEKRPRQMTVLAANDEVVEHRTRGGFSPDRFAWHIANAERYVKAVNALDTVPAAERGPEAAG